MENTVSQLVDFIVEIPVDKDPVVLQLTDPQIIDSAQMRTPDRLTEQEQCFWATDRVEECCYRYIRETVQETKPDLILVTGDLVYGEFDDNGTALQGFIAFMESFRIPWCPIFGNHDNESKMGADWQSEQLENANYCLFQQRTLTGNGNYSVGIMQGGVLKRAFYMVDRNYHANQSSKTLANGHTPKMIGFAEDQINWYTKSITALRNFSPNTKISFVYHVQQAVFQKAFEKYGFDNVDTSQNPINIDRHPNKTVGDFGYLGHNLKNAWDHDHKIWEGMKALGTDSVFVGHEHCNSASVVYDGVRFQYGQKSSAYDRCNYTDKMGNKIFADSCSDQVPLVGGTVMLLSRMDGAIQKAYIYLCKNAGGTIFQS